MATITIHYDPHNKAAQEAINSIINSGVIEKYDCFDPAAQEQGQSKPKKKVVNKGYIYETYEDVPPKLRAEIEKAEADYKAGRYITFNSHEEMRKYYNSL
jgi:hypothetical protein